MILVPFFEILDGVCDKNFVNCCHIHILSHPCSALSNKRAGWNKMCRLENWAKFESIENINLCWMDPNHF